MTDRLTARGAAELVGREAIVPEWYLDSATPPVGTWGIGVTNASGHNVDRYKDNPQPIRRCLEIYIWLLRTRYMPDVLKAFGDRQLSEAEFAAALSWHYNTGAILRTDWVKLVRDGHRREARVFMESHYLNGGDLTSRRKAEAAQFFDGAWSPTNGVATVLQVKKPSYKPDWRTAKRVDIMPDLKALLS